MSDDPDECSLCAGVGEIEAATLRDKREAIPCPECISREHAAEKARWAPPPAISDEQALALCDLAESRNDERTGLASVDVLDERSRIPMEPYIVTMLTRALRQRCPMKVER